MNAVTKEGDENHLKRLYVNVRSSVVVLKRASGVPASLKRWWMSQPLSVFNLAALRRFEHVHTLDVYACSFVCVSLCVHRHISK